MRRITEQAVEAFWNRTPFRKDNTEVRVDGDVYMLLHGNVIAKWAPDEIGGDDLSVTLAGWPTPTTRERLNGILGSEGCAVFQRDGEQFFEIDGNTFKIGDSDWVSIPTDPAWSKLDPSDGVPRYISRKGHAKTLNREEVRRIFNR